jgi:cell division protein FtsW (lipid II flippase)
VAIVSRNAATILILLIGEASGVFAGFCPSWFTVASPFFHEQEAKEGNVKRIRAGEIAATAIVMGTGWAVSQSDVGNFALYAAAGICVVFVAGYEYQIAHPSKEAKTA